MQLCLQPGPTWATSLPQLQNKGMMVPYKEKLWRGKSTKPSFPDEFCSSWGGTGLAGLLWDRLRQQQRGH